MASLKFDDWSVVALWVSVVSQDSYKWERNPNTNTPTIVAGVGTDEDFYIVSEDATADVGIDSIWKPFAWQSVIFTGGERVSWSWPAGSVSSVNGQVGIVTITAGNTSYNNVLSWLSATFVQGAIDEIIAQKWVANWIATLGADWKVPVSQLPNYFGMFLWNYSVTTDWQALPTAENKGDFYVIETTPTTQAFLIWTTNQLQVENGDTLYAKVDTPSTTDWSDWFVSQGSFSWDVVLTADMNFAINTVADLDLALAKLRNRTFSSDTGATRTIYFDFADGTFDLWTGTYQIDNITTDQNTRLRFRNLGGNRDNTIITYTDIKFDAKASNVIRNLRFLPKWTTWNLFFGRETMWIDIASFVMDCTNVSNIVDNSYYTISFDWCYWIIEDFDIINNTADSLWASVFRTNNNASVYMWDSNTGNTKYTWTTTNWWTISSSTSWFTTMVSGMTCLIRSPFVKENTWSVNINNTWTCILSEAEKASFPMTYVKTGYRIFNETTNKFEFRNWTARVVVSQQDLTNYLDKTTDPYLVDIVEWTNISIDKTDPKNPIISSIGGDGWDASFTTVWVGWDYLTVWSAIASGKYLLKLVSNVTETSDITSTEDVFIQSDWVFYRDFGSYTYFSWDLISSYKLIIQSTTVKYNAPTFNTAFAYWEIYLRDMDIIDESTVGDKTLSYRNSVYMFNVKFYFSNNSGVWLARTWWYWPSYTYLNQVKFIWGGSSCTFSNLVSYSGRCNVDWLEIVGTFGTSALQLRIRTIIKWLSIESPNVYLMQYAKECFTVWWIINNKISSWFLPSSDLRMCWLYLTWWVEINNNHNVHIGLSDISWNISSQNAWSSQWYTWCNIRTLTTMQTKNACFVDCVFYNDITIQSSAYFCRFIWCIFLWNVVCDSNNTTFNSCHVGEKWVTWTTKTITINWNDCVLIGNMTDDVIINNWTGNELVANKVF